MYQSILRLELLILPVDILFVFFLIFIICKEYFGIPFGFSDVSNIYLKSTNLIENLIVSYNIRIKTLKLKVNF